MNLPDATDLISHLYIAQTHAEAATKQFYSDSLLGPPMPRDATLLDTLDDLHEHTLTAYTAILEARTDELTPANALLHTVVLVWDYEGDGLHNE